MSADYDPSSLCALVVDDNHYQRGISMDILRTIGVGRVLQASNTAEAWDLVVTKGPDCIFLDWMAGDFDGLALMRRVRQSEESPNRAVLMFLLTERGSQADVEIARKAGANAFLRKPISVSALETRLKAIVSRPQKFVETASYVGPCRRRREAPDYNGVRRRLSDRAAEAVVHDDDDVKRELAKARVAVLEAMAQQLDPANPDSARRVFMAARDLEGVAERIGDRPLTLGAKELVRYIETHGASAGLDFEALRTHIAALHQLVHLPNAMGAERQAVAQSLTKMVDKILRQSAA